jgi:hypothetical protein
MGEMRPFSTTPCIQKIAWFFNIAAIGNLLNASRGTGKLVRLARGREKEKSGWS